MRALQFPGFFYFVNGDRVAGFDKIDADPVIDDDILFLPFVGCFVDEPPHGNEIGAGLHGDVVRKQPELGRADDVVVDLRAGEETLR